MNHSDIAKQSLRRHKTLSRIKYAIIFFLVLAFAILAYLFINDPPEILRGTSKAELPYPGARVEVKRIVDYIWENDREMFYSIRTVSLSDEEMGFFSSQPFHADLFGVYFNDTIALKTSNNMNLHQVYHEMGHNVWLKFTDEKRAEWESVFHSSSNYVTPYGATGAVEDFSETFACYFYDKNGCMEKTEEQKRFFMENVLD
jgi:ABC-type microcin C transport system permease subunit YejE